MTQDEIIELACQTFGGIIKKEERKNFLAFAKLVAEKAIKEALAQPETDPVAWLDEYGNAFPLAAKQYSIVGKHWKPLYTTPSHCKPLTKWQPIETAPKDGTEILMTNGVDVSSGQWFSEYGGTYDQEGAPNGDGCDAGWMDWSGGIPGPTHWMPLPPPPIEATPGIKE